MGASPGLPYLQFKGEEKLGADKAHSPLLSMSLLSQQPGMMLPAGPPPHFHWGNIGNLRQITKDAGG